MIKFLKHIFHLLNYSLKEIAFTGKGMEYFNIVDVFIGIQMCPALKKDESMLGN